MKVVYYLESCNTCKKILNKIQLPKDIIYRELKKNPIIESELNELYLVSKSYESLLNKRAKLYQEYKLKDKNLSDDEYKKYLLEHYTFLNRPIFLFENNIFIGNSEKNIQSLETFLSNEF